MPQLLSVTGVGLASAHWVWGQTPGPGTQPGIDCHSVGLCPWRPNIPEPWEESGRWAVIPSWEDRGQPGRVSATERVQSIPTFPFTDLLGRFFKHSSFSCSKVLMGLRIKSKLLIWSTSSSPLTMTCLPFPSSPPAFLSFTHTHTLSRLPLFC